MNQSVDHRHALVDPLDLVFGPLRLGSRSATLLDLTLTLRLSTPRPVAVGTVAVSILHLCVLCVSTIKLMIEHVLTTLTVLR
jgi:hypothetical protein